MCTHSFLLGTANQPAQTPNGFGMSGAETMRVFEDQLAATTSAYVEEGLAAQFGELVSFVKVSDSHRL